MQTLQHQRQCRRIGHAANTDGGLAQLDFDAAGTASTADRLFRLGRQRHRQKLRCVPSKPARNWRRQRNTMFVFSPCCIASWATDTDSSHACCASRRLNPSG